MTDPERIPHDPHLDQPPPRLRAIVACCVVTWLWSCIGVATAIWQHDWLVLAWAANAAIVAAGWLMAARQWSWWRAMALEGAQAVQHLLRQLGYRPDER